MSIAKQQNAVLDEAKQVFAKTLGDKVDAMDEASATMMEEAVAQAIKDTLQHLQDEYGDAIAFYIAHDFQRVANADPDSPFKLEMGIEFESSVAQN